VYTHSRNPLTFTSTDYKTIRLTDGNKTVGLSVGRSFESEQVDQGEPPTVRQLRTVSRTQDSWLEPNEGTRPQVASRSNSS